MEVVFKLTRREVEEACAQYLARRDVRFAAPPQLAPNQEFEHMFFVGEIALTQPSLHAEPVVERSPAPTHPTPAPSPAPTPDARAAGQAASSLAASAARKVKYVEATLNPAGAAPSVRGAPAESLLSPTSGVVSALLPSSVQAFREGRSLDDAAEGR